MRYTKEKNHVSNGSGEKLYSHAMAIKVLMYRDGHAYQQPAKLGKGRTNTGAVFTLVSKKPFS